MSTQRSFFLIPIITLLLFCFSCQNNTPKIDMEIEVPNFGLHDHEGKFHTLYYYNYQKAVVLFTQMNGCSTVENDLATLKNVKKEFKGQPVEFFMINSNIKNDRTSIAEEAEKLDFDLPVLIDENQFAAEAMQLHKSGEVLVLDPENWTIAYRGPIEKGDNNLLKLSLDALMKGEYLAENYIPAKGKFISLKHPNPNQFANISYEKEIAPLLIEKCGKCHVEGGIAPFAMDKYETVFGWSAMIQEVLRTKRMPPWQADPHYGEWADNMSLTNEEIQKIVHWIDAGAKKDSEEDPLKELKPVKDKWLMGEPELVITLEKEDIPAKGIIDYRYQEIDLELEEDVWATAIQVLPDNQEVLHHLLVSVVYPDGFVEPIDRRSPWLDGLLAAWAPGQMVEVFPKNTGRILPKGSKLHFQLHYTSNAKAQSDQSIIGIYTTNEEPEHEYLLAGAFNPEIVLQPNDPNYENRAKYKFKEETTLFGLSPHMHFRGKAMKFTALYPDGTKEILLNVPNYNFNWQRSYVLKEPKVLPARTVVYVDAVFDNSAQNSFNPAPEKTVYWGDFSFDEMLIGYMSFMYGRHAVPDNGSLSMK